MQEPQEARNAFRGLAYRKFKEVPLYLEWAPDGSMLPQEKKPEPPKKASDTRVNPRNATQPPAATFKPKRKPRLAPPFVLANDTRSHLRLLGFRLSFRSFCLFCLSTFSVILVFPRGPFVLLFSPFSFLVKAQGRGER